MSAPTTATRREAEDGRSPSGYQRLKPGPSQSQLDVIASQRARLQRAVVELSSREGCGAVTVRKLTKLAGVSTGSFYQRFAGTDDCLLAAFGEIMDGASARMSATRSPDLAPGRQIEATLRSLFDQLLADPVVARFVLVEIYEGGPAALGATAAQEQRLGRVLQGCLDRRGRRIPVERADAIIAASLHCVRVRTMDTSKTEAEATIDALIGWARHVIDGKEDLGFLAQDTRAVHPVDDEDSELVAHLTPCGRDEEDILLAAVLRLASRDGFFGLTQSKVSSAAGVPTARLRRHFTNLADGYLAALRRTCRSFFIELTPDVDGRPVSSAAVRSALQQARRRAAFDPVSARLTFRGIVDPGIRGLTCREALISELAMACTPESCNRGDLPPIGAEARAAAIWGVLASTGESPSRRS
jgi:AcrR family transcriptional regulator